MTWEFFLIEEVLHLSDKISVFGTDLLIFKVERFLALLIGRCDFSSAIEVAIDP